MHCANLTTSCVNMLLGYKTISEEMQMPRDKTVLILFFEKQHVY